MVREEKRLIYLKELLQHELQDPDCSWAYVDDLKLSIRLIERQMQLPAYEMLENVE